MTAIRKSSIGVLLMVLLIGGPPSCFGWNERGHKVVAYIAYQQLDPATRSKVAELLRQHPEFADWRTRGDGGPNQDLNLFLYAAVFADEVRGESHPLHAMNEPAAHYVGFPYIPRIEDQQNPEIQPLDPVGIYNSLKAYRLKRDQVRDALVAPRDRAVALTWIFHLAGDVHQPLHNVSRHSAAFPQGDRGGNDVRVVNPRGDDRLHAYWDELLGGGRLDPFANVQQTADELLADSQLQRDKLPQSEISGFEVWCQEGLALAKSTVYQGLDPLDRNPPLPPGYEDNAMQLARRQIVLAGYRLANELRAISRE